MHVGRASISIGQHNSLIQDAISAAGVYSSPHSPTANPKRGKGGERKAGLNQSVDMGRAAGPSRLVAIYNPKRRIIVRANK